MTLLLDVAPFIPPARAHAPGAEIYRRFELEPDTLAIAIVDDDHRPIGLVERNAFLVLMAAQHGYALWANRPISRIMKGDPLTVDGDVTVEDFCGSVLQDRPSDLLHGFVVTCGGRYAGVGSMLALLQASAAATAEASRRAQDALALRTRFLAVMSHEIRTPLNGILGVAEIVRRKSIQPELAPLLDTIAQSGAILLRLLNDALDMSRGEASGLDLNEAPMAVGALADNVRRLWSPQAELRQIDLRVHYDGPADLWALGDAVRLGQVLDNLVSNALKFTATGSIEVRLSAQNEGGCVWLEGAVADTGPGIPADKRDLIFAPFQQTDEGLRLGGAGLGLAVCRQLVERMNGRIDVTANPGGGALFEFAIPLFGVPAEAAPAEAPQRIRPLEDAEHPALHVLIADDNATNRLVAQSLCEIFNCTTESVADGLQAVEAVARGGFDLILMDIKMPQMDGVEATRRIRSGGGPEAGVPIIALTANADPDDAAFYSQCGMNGVVKKPIDPAQLNAAMAAALNVRAEPGSIQLVA